MPTGHDASTNASAIRPSIRLGLILVSLVTSRLLLPLHLSLATLSIGPIGYRLSSSLAAAAAAAEDDDEDDDGHERAASFDSSCSSS